jgi:hypothetical protein
MLDILFMMVIISNPWNNISEIYCMPGSVFTFILYPTFYLHLSSYHPSIYPLVYEVATKITIIVQRKVYTGQENKLYDIMYSVGAELAHGKMGACVISFKISYRDILIL